MSEPRITLEDVVRAGHCVSGARHWFTLHGFNWREVTRNGVTEAELLATNDALAVKVIEHKRARDNG